MSDPLKALTLAELAAEMRAKVHHWYLSGESCERRSKSLRAYIDNDLWGAMFDLAWDQDRLKYDQDKIEASRQAYALAWLLGKEDADRERATINPKQSTQPGG